MPRILTPVFRPMTGARFLVRHTASCFPCLSHPHPPKKTETMAEHRARSLSALLPIALATGYSEIEPDLEPLKVTYRPTRVMRNLTKHPRTLTPIFPWKARIHRLALSSLTATKSPQLKSRGILWCCLSIGLPVLRVNPYLMQSGLRDSHRISKGWLTYVSIMSGFGWIRI